MSTFQDLLNRIPELRTTKDELYSTNTSDEMKRKLFYTMNLYKLKQTDIIYSIFEDAELLLKKIKQDGKSESFARNTLKHLKMLIPAFTEQDKIELKDTLPKYIDYFSLYFGLFFSNSNHVYWESIEAIPEEQKPEELENSIGEGEIVEYNCDSESEVEEPDDIDIDIDEELFTQDFLSMFNKIISFKQEALKNQGEKVKSLITAKDMFIEDQATYDILDNKLNILTEELKQDGTKLQKLFASFEIVSNLI